VTAVAGALGPTTPSPWFAGAGADEVSGSSLPVTGFSSPASLAVDGRSGAGEAAGTCPSAERSRRCRRRRLGATGVCDEEDGGARPVVDALAADVDDEWRSRRATSALIGATPATTTAAEPSTDIGACVDGACGRLLRSSSDDCWTRPAVCIPLLPGTNRLSATERLAVDVDCGDDVARDVTCVTSDVIIIIITRRSCCRSELPRDAGHLYRKPAPT